MKCSYSSHSAKCLLCIILFKYQKMLWFFFHLLKSNM